MPSTTLNPDPDPLRQRLPQRAAHLATAVANLLTDAAQAGAPVPPATRAASATLTRWAISLRAPHTTPPPTPPGGHRRELAAEAERAAEQLLALATRAAIHGELAPWGIEQTAATLRDWAHRHAHP